MGLEKVIDQERLHSSQGVETGTFAPRPPTDLVAHAEIASMVAEVYSPAKFPNLNENQVSTMMANVFDKLDTDLRRANRLEVISTLLSQTLNSDSSSATEIRPGEDLKGTLRIMQDSGRGSTLSILAALDSSEMSASLARNHSFEKMYTSFVLDLLNPEGVDQGEHNTCSVTCSQMHQLARDPSGLAAYFAEQVRTYPKTLLADDRTLASTLLQCSMMDIVGYNQASDMTIGKAGEHPGLFSGQLWEVLCKSTGKPYQIAYEADRKIINENLAVGRAVILVAEGIGGGNHAWHDILLKEIKVDPVSGIEMAYFQNPWPDKWINKGNGVEIVDKATGICKMPADTLFANTKYMAHETTDLNDLNRPPANTDEKEYIAQSGNIAQVFTVSVQIEDTTETMRRLNLIKRLRDQTNTRLKIDDPYEKNFELVREKLLAAKEN